MFQNINNAFEYPPETRSSKYEWTPDLDKFLISQRQTTEEYKPSWSHIASLVERMFNQNIPHQTLRHHYIEITSSAKKGVFTNEEKKQIISEVLQHGTKWAVIGPILNRTQTAVKNCYRYIINNERNLNDLINDEPTLFPQGAPAVIKILKDIQSKARRKPPQIRNRKTKANSSSNLLIEKEISEKQNHSFVSLSSTTISNSAPFNSIPINEHAALNIQYPDSSFALDLPIIDQNLADIMNSNVMHNTVMDTGIIDNAHPNVTQQDNDSLSALASFESTFLPQNEDSHYDFLRYLNY